MEPNSIIPDHTHGVDATMYPVSGSARLIADDEEFNGRRVTVGQAVRFPAHRLHGFVAGPEGFSFVSVNGGIVDVDPGMWDISFR
jgi:quercetin dioxygenase-like cupin family protein